MSPMATLGEAQDLEFLRVDGRMFLRPVGRVEKPDDHKKDRKNAGEHKGRTPAPPLHSCSEHDGCKYSARTNPAKQEATTDTSLPHRHPISDDFVRIGITRGLARSRQEPNRHKGPRQSPQGTFANCP